MNMLVAGTKSLNVGPNFGLHEVHNRLRIISILMYKYAGV